MTHDVCRSYAHTGIFDAAPWFHLLPFNDFTALHENPSNDRFNIDHGEMFDRLASCRDSQVIDFYARNASFLFKVIMNIPPLASQPIPF
jgi:hypothetical protein